MKHIITISGKLGSGKSSAAKKVAEHLGYQYFSSGDFLREVAKERSMSIKDLMVAAETDSTIDYDIDSFLKEKQHEENLVIDSRLAFHWIPESFKVFLEINPRVAAKRMFKDLETNTLRKASEHVFFFEEMEQNMHARHESDKKRYQKLYNIDHTNHNHFDLVIDTGKEENTLDVVVEKIITAYKEHLDSGL